MFLMQFYLCLYLSSLLIIDDKLGGTSQIGALWLYRVGRLILVLGYVGVVVSLFFVICVRDFSNNSPYSPSCNTRDS